MKSVIPYTNGLADFFLENSNEIRFYLFIKYNIFGECTKNKKY